MRTPLLRLINPVDRVVPSIRLIDEAKRFPVLSVKVDRKPGTGVERFVVPTVFTVDGEPKIFVVPVVITVDGAS